MIKVIQEQSGEFNSVGGQHYPSRAIVREKLFSNRLAAEQSAICGVIIHCYIADVIYPNNEFLPNQLLLAWEFDDGAMVFGAYEPIEGYYCESCHDIGCSACDDSIWYDNEESVWKEHHPWWGVPGGEW
jgi:hypothetical protein